MELHIFNKKDEMSSFQGSHSSFKERTVNVKHTQSQTHNKEKMVTGNSFHIYLEPDVPKSLFELIEDEEILLKSNDVENNIQIALRINLVSIDTNELLPEGEKDASKSKISTLYIVRHNELYDEEYELEDILAGLGKDEEGESECENKDSEEKNPLRDSNNDDEFQEYVLANLGDKRPLQTQQQLNLALIQETDANVQFVVRGPRGMFVTGNYILH